MKITPQTLYEILFNRFGNLDWWPMDEEYHKKNGSDQRFEIIAGAILTQNTAWSNVEKAISSLKIKKVLDINSLSKVSTIELQKLIRSSGFFKQKADRLKNIALYFQQKYQGDLDTFFKKDIYDIRNELLSLNGIGPETADSILLYAGNLPIFVVDAYTKRICERLPLNTNISYEAIQSYFERELEKSYTKNELIKIYNNLHALIVILGKNYCKKNPRCEECPLTKHCDYNKNSAQ